jgi:nicotinamide riboside transporter PnuC
MLDPKMLSIIDVIAQVWITIFGVGAILLVSRKDRRGFVLGIISQPGWFATAFINRQWGVIALNFVYGGVWLYGFWRWYFKEKPDAFRQE